MPEQFRAEIDAAPSLSDYTLTAGMVNANVLPWNVDASLLTDGVHRPEAWPLMPKSRVAWGKFLLETLRRLMGL